MLLFDQGLTLNSIIDIQKVGSLIALQSFVTASFSLSLIYICIQGVIQQIFLGGGIRWGTITTLIKYP